jgi:hypothetical protein
VRADLHLSEASKDAPQGDLYTYTLAEKDPEAFGASMVFDGKAETRFNEDGTPQRDANGKPLPRLARVEKLYASDVVDDPAANPDGLFSAEESLAEKCSAFLNRWAENTLVPLLQEEFARVMELQTTGALKAPSRVQSHTSALSKPAFSIWDETRRMTGQLQGARWTDAALQLVESAALQLVESEDLAREAYQLSGPLRVEFQSEGNYLAYWRSLRAVQRKG